MPRIILSLLLLSGALLSHAQGLNLDVNSVDSIKSVASSIAKVVVGYYNGTQAGNTPGILGQPYHWWEGGALFDTLIEYWHYTGDNSYNSIVTQALLFQRGDSNDYMPANQSKSLGNDDQDVWALAAMSAAESELTDPPAGNPTWIALARNVLDDQISRWDAATCGGGLRWQVFAFNNGYNYKNSASNGGFFQLAARYARYTNNQTYAAWAEKVYDWTRSISLLDDQWNVYDGTQVTLNCTSINHLQFSYVAGTYITGAAHMYNMTNGAAKWKTALDGLLNSTLSNFFPNDILTEGACEPAQTCTVDMKSFKGMTARWLTATVQMAPYTSSLILPKLTASAQAAVKQCDGNIQCGFKWTGDKSDGDTGLGQQMNALAVVQALLVGNASLPATVTNGGTDPGNSSSSSNSSTSTGASNVSGAGSTSSSTAGAAATSATSKPSSASELSLDTAKLGMFSVLIAFLLCIML